MYTLANTRAEHKRNIEPKELESWLGRKEGPQLVDVREYPEFAAGHIVGARILPLSDLERRSVELDRTRPVVCVCRSGKRSAQAVDALTALGFTQVHELDGGMEGWKQANLPLEKEAHAPWSLERQVRLTAGLLVLTGLGFSLIWPLAVGLSWFVGVGLVFAAATDWCGMGLLLAKLPWNRPSGKSGATSRV